MAMCRALSNNFGKVTITVMTTTALLLRTTQTPLLLSKTAAAIRLC